MNQSFQTDLDLCDIGACASPLPLALYRAADRSSSISGFVVSLAAAGASLQFRWTHERPYDATVPLAFAAFGDTERACVRIGDIELGRATPMQMLRALLDPGEYPCEVAAALGDLLSSLVTGQESHEVLEHTRRRLIATLAGAMSPVVQILARQRMLAAVWAPRFEWRRAIAEYQRLRDQGGMEEYLALVLGELSHLPSKGLVVRLKRIGSHALSGAFVRSAAGIGSMRERMLFEHALQASLKRLLKRWRETNAALDHVAAARTCAHLLMAVERLAFARACVDERKAFSAAAARGTFAFPINVKPLQRVVHAPIGDQPVRASRLLAWAERCTNELSAGAHATAGAIGAFRYQCNEVLDAVLAGTWTCDELRHTDWIELVQLGLDTADWARPVLPDLAWPCELPVGTKTLLGDVGLDLSPIACTGELIREAAEMENCLASSRAYLDELLAGRSRIFRIAGDGVRATMQLSHHENGWYVEQVRGRRNEPLEDELAHSPMTHWQALRAFVAQFRESPRPPEGLAIPTHAWLRRRRSS